MKWSNITETDSVTNKLTYINATGIYTGTINADNINAGTLNADRIAVNSLTANHIQTNTITTLGNVLLDRLILVMESSLLIMGINLDC